MNQSLRETIRLWKTEQDRGYNESFWQFLVRTNPWVFAHHPADACFQEHVWTFRGLYFCKGCAMTVLGWLVAVSLQLSTDWLQCVAIGYIAVSFVGLLLPAVATALWGAPRIWKHVARVLLGVVMVSAIWLFVITDQWMVRGIVALVYFAVKLPLDRRRRRQNGQLLLQARVVPVAGSRHQKKSHRRRNAH